MRNDSPTREGFSLVELSIVLVILGLLVGGVLSGQSLIRVSEIRSITGDFQRYQTAAQSFRDKYFAIPGDMTNATQFWGANGSCTASGVLPFSATARTTTCNGDGNGSINGTNGAHYYSESWRFWQHLSNAGLIEGTYSGACGAAAPGNCLTGANTPQNGLSNPRSKISNMGFSVINFGESAAIAYGPDIHYFAGTYGNSFIFGGDGNPFNYSAGAGTGIRADEAYNIDTKIDDGKPASGKLRVGAYYANGCSTTTVAATAIYFLTGTGSGCSLIFDAGF